MSIEHLSDEQVEDLMNRYYAGEDQKKLTEEFQIKVTNGRLYTLFPSIVREDLDPCPYCGIYPTQKRASKTKMRDGYRLPVPFCTECGHNYSGSCNCQNCLSKHKKEELLAEKELEDKIQAEMYGTRDSAITVNQLSLKEAVDLISLERGGREEDNDIIRAIKYFDRPAGPSQDYSVNALKHLYKNKLIDFSPSTSTDHFEISGKRLEIRNYSTVYWKLHLGRDLNETIDIIDNIRSCLCKYEKWPSNWQFEFYDLWLTLALHENIQFLKIMLDTYNLPCRIGDKTIRALRSLLDTFSISQSYYFIYASVRDASAYQRKNGVSVLKAMFTIPGNIHRLAEKAICEEWVIKKYSRNTRCPESLSTTIFSNVVAQFHSKYFDKCPYNMLDSL